MSLFITALIVLIFLILGIDYWVLSVKKEKCKKILRKYPTSFFLQMYNRDEFTYYDKILKSRLHNKDYLKNTTEETIDTMFRKKQCNAILSLAEKKYEQWQNDFNYASYICKKYNDALFKYIVDNRIWESWNIEPNDVNENYLECLDMDLLHKLTEAKECEYAQLQKEYNSLYEIVNKKSDANNIIEYFKKNKIRYLYHFTDIRNIPSIVSNGGLFSWVYCEKNGINITNPGGGSLSRSLDIQNKVADYVHLSFTAFHPMKYKKETDGAKMFLLKIHPSVSIFNDTLFSSTNATDTRAQIGSDYNALFRINYEATQKSFLKHEDPDFKYSQAEVLVKSHIPLKYIINLKDNC